MYHKAMAQGKSRIFGLDRHISGHGAQHYARTYVEGLERDRQELQVREQELNATIWEAVQLGAYNRALFRSMQQLLGQISRGEIQPEFLDQVETLLQEVKPLYESIYECECGHSKYDHDEQGCQFLGCIPICGVGKKRSQDDQG